MKIVALVAVEACAIRLKIKSPEYLILRPRGGDNENIINSYGNVIFINNDVVLGLVAFVTLSQNDDQFLKNWHKYEKIFTLLS